jgi:hypothetical protein
MRTPAYQLLPISTAMFALLAIAGNTGFVRAVVIRVGLVVGVGGGRGTLVFHDHSYSIIFSGLSPRRDGCGFIGETERARLRPATDFGYRRVRIAQSARLLRWLLAGEACVSRTQRGWF